MRVFPGFSFLLIGSGLYWILSSQLIFSFTVLFPYQFESSPVLQEVITSVGIVSLTAGLWLIDVDLKFLSRLLAGTRGAIFALPIVFATIDVYSTMISLSFSSQAIELNPLVASVIQNGLVAMVPYVLSYFALSQGAALFLLAVGKLLFPASSSLQFLPFAMVCGAASFGPFNNLSGLGNGFGSIAGLLIGSASSICLTISVFVVLRGATPLRISIRS